VEDLHSRLFCACWLVEQVQAVRRAVLAHVPLCHSYGLVMDS